MNESAVKVCAQFFSFFDVRFHFSGVSAQECSCWVVWLLYIWVFLRTYQAVFQRGCSILHLFKQCMEWSSFSRASLPAFGVSLLLILAILVCILGDTLGFNLHSPDGLPGEPHGQRSLVGYSPRGLKESDTTERLHFTFTMPDDGGFPGGSDGKVSACSVGDLGVRKILWRRKQQPTPVLLPGRFHGWRNLVGYSPWGHTELVTLSDFTWWLMILIVSFAYFPSLYPVGAMSLHVFCPFF